MSLTHQLSFFATSADADPQEHPPIDHEFDARFADTLARYESYNKHLYRPNTYLYKWWARRCGTTFRTILKHLVPDPRLQDYYAPGGLEGLTILDPMMGGGTTLHEAIRLGANVVGADIDPIPVLQARASLTQIPLPDLQRAWRDFYHSLYQALHPLFQTRCPECGAVVDLQYTLYASRQTCDCGKAWIVDSYVLRHNSDDSVVRICPDCHQITTDDMCHCSPGHSWPPLLEKDIKSCPKCGATYQEMLDLPFYARYAPISVVATCPTHGLFFASPRPDDLHRLQEADSVRHDLFPDPLDHFRVDPGPKSRDLVQRRITSYLDLYSSRQLLYLRHAIDALDALPPLIRLNFALLISTSLEFNTMLCGYKGAGKRRPGAVRHAFSHHAYTFPYTALENNPILPDRASGTLQSLFYYRIEKARKWAANPKERRIVDGRADKVTIRPEVDAGIEVDDPGQLATGHHRFMLLQGSSTHLQLPSDSIDYVVTDPPYFDSVQYSDLAAFFRVWLRTMLPDAATWEYDIDKSAVDPHANGKGQYASALSGIFAECNRVLKPDTGRMIFTYHHWNPKGWAALTRALKAGRFTLINRYVVHSENPASVHILDLKALKHDAVLVFAPRSAGLQSTWPRPTVISSDDSRHFTSDCASALGWMLNEDLDEPTIDALWGKLLPA